MPVKRIILATVALVVAAVAIPKDASACSCGTMSLASRFDYADNVFTAIITNEYVEPSAVRSPTRSLFTVTESFKGARPFGALIPEQIDGASCGIDLEIGVEYLIFAPNSGQIGSCSVVQPVGSAEPTVNALRAYVSGKSPDVSEPWRFISLEDSCGLNVAFESGEERFNLGSLRFGHRKGAEFAENPTDLRIRVGVYDLKPEGAHNPLRIYVGDESYVLPWNTERVLEQVLEDGSTRTLSYAGDFVLQGREVSEILAGLEQVDFVVVSFDSSGFGPHINARVGTANLGSGAAEMLSCIRPN